MDDSRYLFDFIRPSFNLKPKLNIEEVQPRKGQVCAICEQFFLEDEDPLIAGWCTSCHKSTEATQNEIILKEGENGDRET